ncbi:MAG TPA: hypothetical protein VGR28_04880 [Candidatus Thermoplasmatota archaeon]|jgi:hypothetical protein|nr:hypothetical protein [Candidatus Thermoplasmatota archaeon]
MTRVLGEDEAVAWVLALLRDGHARTTREVDEAARSQGVSCPDGTPRFLARLHRRGLLEGRLDVAQKAWVWWLPATLPA